MSLDDRNLALMNLDLAWARRNVPKWVAPPSDETLLLALHKARYECRDLPDDVRHESAKFLRDGGFKNYYGEDILPEGKLP